MEQSEEVQSRLMSAEWEMAVVDRSKGGSPYWLTSKPGFFYEPIEGVTSYWNETPGTVSSSYIFLTNGARWYRDTLDNAELALPECLGADQLTEYIVASNYFVAGAIARYGTPETHLHRRLFSPESKEALGFHENYNVYRRDGMERAQLAVKLAPFLISRIVFNGAGSAQLDNKGQPAIVPAQRAQHVTRAISGSATSRQKPWILGRLEDLNGNNNDYLRLQITGGDTSISPWASRYTFMTTSIILRLIENGLDPDITIPKTLDENAKVIARMTQRAAKDYGGVAKVDVLEGETDHSYRLIDLQEKYFEHARKMAEKGIFSADEAAFLPEWGEAIDQFRRDPLLLADAVDWICKLWLVNEKGMTDLERMQKLDMAYDAIAGVKKRDPRTPTHGIGMRLLESGHYRYNPDPEAVQNSLRSAPGETRARHRAELVRALHDIPDSRSSKSVDWFHVKLRYTGDAGKVTTATVPLYNPLNGGVRDYGDTKKIFDIATGEKQQRLAA